MVEQKLIHFEEIERMLRPQDVDMLEMLYQEPHRKYHNVDHINDMLFQARKDGFRTNSSLMLSILWHDAVYYPQSKLNEELSAALFRSITDSMPDVYVAILASKTHFDSRWDTAEDWVQYFLDYDLMGLSAPFNKFYDNTLKIWAEYAPVTPWEVFRDGRIKFLRAIHDKGVIYRKNPQLNTTAILNIRKELIWFINDQNHPGVSQNMFNDQLMESLPTTLMRDMRARGYLNGTTL